MQGDAVHYWLNSAGRAPLLTTEQEILFGNQIQAWQTAEDPDQRTIRRGQRAKERMIASNMRLVVGLARKFRYRLGECNAIELEDLLQEGCFGLNRAAEKFDPTTGYKFSTYAYWWIRQAITRFIDLGGTIRVPGNIQGLIKRYHRRPEGQSIEEFAEANRTTPEKMQNLLKWQQRAKVVSLDCHCIEDGSALNELIGDEASALNLEVTDLADALDNLRNSDSESVRDAIAVMELEQTSGPAELASLIGVHRREIRHEINNRKALLREHCPQHIVERLVTPKPIEKAIIREDSVQESPIKAVRPLVLAVGSNQSHPADESMTYQPPQLRPDGFQPEESEVNTEALERLVADVPSDPEPEVKPERKRRRQPKQHKPAPAITVAVDGRQFAGGASDVAQLLLALEEAA